MKYNFSVPSADLEAVFDPCNILSSESFQGKKQDLDPESHDQEGKVQDDLHKRHVLIDQVNIVSG